MIEAQTKAGARVCAFALSNYKALSIVFLGICVLGLYALFNLPSGIYPDVAFPRIVVIAEHGEDSVETMLIGITRPIEEAVNAIPGLTRMRSRTIRGSVEISLDFEPRTDMLDALSQARARAVEATADTEKVALTIERQTPSVFPVISLNLSLDSARAAAPVNSVAALNEWAQLNLKPRLARLPDAYMVSVQGAETHQVTVEADPLALAAAGLTLDDLVKAIREANMVGAVGLLERDYRQFQLLVSCEITKPEQLEQIPIFKRKGQPILLGQLARVRMDVAERTSVVTGDGHDSVVVSLFMRYGGKVTQLSADLQGILDETRSLLPPGVAIRQVYDQARLVHDSISGVRDAIVIGMILAVAVLWIFLGSWPLTLIAGISIPLSVLGTFAFMQWIGESLNLMSLGGIAIAIGLIIDDAIVVVENIERHSHAEALRSTAVIQATGEITGAVVGSSLTTVVVFFPLVLLQGIVGQFFRAFATALTTGILVSMVVSLTLVPILAARRSSKCPQPAQRRWLTRLADTYGRCIQTMLHRPKLWAAILVGILVIGGLATWGITTGFLPEMDEGGVVLDYTMPVGTSLSETDRNCRAIEALLLQTSEIESFSRRTGAELGFFATEQFTGDFLIGFKPRGQRDHSSAEVVDDLRLQIATRIPQIEVSFVQIMQDTINDLAGNPAPLEVKVFGNDYHKLDEVAAQVAPAIGNIQGIVDVSSSLSFGSPEITYQVDEIAAARTGMTAKGIADQMRQALFGEQASLLRKAERLIPIVVRYPDVFRHDLGWLQRLPLFDGQGNMLPVSALAHVEEAVRANELSRENQQPLVNIEANISGIDLGTAAQRLKDYLATVQHPADVRFEIGGQVQSQRNAFEQLLLVLFIGIGLVWLLLVIQFRSYRLPLIIFITLPPAQIGALLALRCMDIPLNISSFMGLIMLIGLVVKNGIIFIEYTAQLRQEGVPTLAEALETAARVRLRPILMTSLTAIIALLPLAFNLGAGAELQRPLAVAVIGGLTVSTCFTLLIIPLAHLILGEPASELAEVQG